MFYALWLSDVSKLRIKLCEKKNTFACTHWRVVRVSLFAVRNPHVLFVQPYSTLRDLVYPLHLLHLLKCVLFEVVKLRFFFLLSHFMCSSRSMNAIAWNELQCIPVNMCIEIELWAFTALTGTVNWIDLFPNWCCCCCCGVRCWWCGKRTKQITSITYT